MSTPRVASDVHAALPNDVSDSCVLAARRAIRAIGRLPRPGAGATAQRWQVFADLAGNDLSLARLVEGHFDARAILHELGFGSPSDSELLGVWAARPAQLTATRLGQDWLLEGQKPFCSGSTAVDSALVTAVADDGVRLFLVPGDAAVPDPSSWQPLGMAATRSETMQFPGAHVGADAAVGGPGAYVERPGFGHGGCGVAACWWGGATALMSDVRAAVHEDPGPLQAAAYAVAALAMDGAARVLRDAAAAIDAAPDDVSASNRWAAVCRCVTAAACRDVLALASAHIGTSVIATRPHVSRRMTDLATYLTQFHDETAIELGRRLLGEEPERLW